MGKFELEVIKKVYYAINNELSGTTNTPEVRHETTHKILVGLEKELVGYKIIVTCNETNNTPQVIDNNQLVAKVQWKLPGRVDKTIHHIDLTFGDVEVIWMSDKEKEL